MVRASSVTSSSSRSTTRRSRPSSRTSSSTGSTGTTRSSPSPWTRATTSPAESARRSRARTGCSTTTRSATTSRPARRTRSARSTRTCSRSPARTTTTSTSTTLRRSTSTASRGRPTRESAPSSGRSGSLTSVDPYVRDSNGVPQTVNLTDALADPVELAALHMVNADPNRTPTFVDFGNPDFFFQESNCSGGATECAASGFAWNHGDVQNEIGEHLGRHGRARRREQRDRPNDVDRPHEPASDDPLARRPQGRLHPRRPYILEALERPRRAGRSLGSEGGELGRPTSSSNASVRRVSRRHAEAAST